ncbi:MAG: D-glycero-beta-D-manno-heptose-7-phosphate kinase [Calditrichales bacterium]|nr:MAG: D-glycero-beta-D-manno-heptose-7-phosphate kinase [Calditrichales bacterium]
MIQFDQDRLGEIFSGFSGKRIMVVGDLMIDEYLIGHVRRISPEAPVPVVDVKGQSVRLGGAANVALNIRSLGCNPIMVGVVGDDHYGTKLLKLLSKQGVGSDGVIRIPGRPTTVKTRIIGDSQHIARVDHEDATYLRHGDEENIFEKVTKILDSVDGVILQDYNKGVLTEDLIEFVVSHARQKNLLITVDPKFKNFLKFRNVTVFKPNIKETEEALAVKINNEADLLMAGKQLKQSLNADNILITRGSDGMSLFESDDRVMHVPTRVRKVADVSGAGDTVISTLTAALAGGASMREAAVIANYAAGIVCEEVGIIPVDKDKLYKVCLGNNT